MASLFNNLLNVEEIGTGEQAGTWGTTTNINLATTLSEAITGRATVTILAPTGPLMLTYTNNNASQGVRNLVLDVRSSGNLTGTSDVIVPNRNKQYIVENNTTGTPTNQSIRVKTSAGTGVTIPPGKIAHVFCDGTNVRFADDFVGITGGTIANVTITSSTITLSSPLAVTQGGTGLSTTSQGDILYSSASNTLVVLPKNTTASRYLSNSGTSNNPAWAQIDLTNGVVNTLPVTSGGTGLNSAVQGDLIYASATNTYIALPKNTTATRYLANTGTSNNPDWAQIDLTNGVVNTLPVNRGGTGVATVTAGALLLGAGTSAFTTLTGTVTGQVVSWNNSTATWEAGTLASGVSSFSAGTTGLTPNTATTGAVTLGGTLDVDNGGTGQTSYTNGQLLIGNSTGNTLAKATLTAGTGISVTNGAGSITIATASPDVQTFNINGTWTKPSAGTMARIQVWGGGGGGYGDNVFEFGGGGGGYNELWIPVSSLAATVSVTIGSGGNGSAVAADNATSGGTSSFGSHCLAYGGSRGSVGPGYGGGQLSAGTTSNNGSPNASRHWEGGRGAEASSESASPPLGSVFGGGGGGTSFYGPITGGASVYGGAGGSSGSFNGVAPGGGGCARINTTSGSGAAGRVVVTVF